MSLNRQNRVMLVEHQENIREMICFSLEGDFNFFVIRCRSVNEALSFLDLDQNIDAVICDGSEVDGSPYDLFDRIMKINSEIPFISTDADSVGIWTPIKGKGLAGKVRRTEVIKSLNNLLKRIFLVDDDAPKEDFTPVSLSSLRYFEGIHEDIYIKLKTGRLVKLFSADHSFGVEDIERYIEKGVQYFYFNRQALHWIRNQIDQGIFILLTSPNATLSLTNSSSTHAEESEIDFDAAFLTRPFDLEKEFVKVITRKQQELVTRFKEIKQFKDFIKALQIDRDETLFLKNRISLVTNISCSLLRQLEWGSDAAYEKMIYVSFIHDLPLFKYPHLAHYETLFEMDLAEDLDADSIEVVKRHTLEVEKIIDADGRAPQEASLICRQHHEISDRKGFPDGLQIQRITPFAAVLAVSISLAQMILAEPDWTLERFEKKYGSRYKGGIFTKIIQALRLLFGKKPIV